jgi:hypothetical protein
LPLAAAAAVLVIFISMSIFSPNFFTAGSLSRLGRHWHHHRGRDADDGQRRGRAIRGLCRGAGGSERSGHDGHIRPAIDRGHLGRAVGGHLRWVMNGLLVTTVNMPPFVATLGMLAVARGVAHIPSEGQAIFGLPKSFGFLGQATLGVIPVSVLASSWWP